MGTDFVELFDKRTAEIIIHGSEHDMIALVESRTRPNTSPPVWHHFFDEAGSMQKIPPETKVADRYKAIASSGMEMAGLKRDLINELCTSDWLYLDYWACAVEVFEGVEPPGSIRWEDFTAERGQPVQKDDDGSILLSFDSSGRYLLTGANTKTMIASLRDHVEELQVMGEADIATLERWHNFCAAHPDFCVIYQMDF